MAALVGAQEVYPGLYLGGRRAALDRAMLQERGISSVLTISEFDSPTLPYGVEGMQIAMRDHSSEVSSCQGKHILKQPPCGGLSRGSPDPTIPPSTAVPQDILSHLPAAFAFISAGLSSSAVLVHCEQVAPTHALRRNSLSVAKPCTFRTTPLLEQRRSRLPPAVPSNAYSHPSPAGHKPERRLLRRLHHVVAAFLPRRRASQGAECASLLVSKRWLHQSADALRSPVMRCYRRL